ncbi:MAG: hypothetical protein FWH03_04920 [Firmicutes bacterium]|nr:hypothetical protein [Bacillota bacterium]
MEYFKEDIGRLDLANEEDDEYEEEVIERDEYVDGEDEEYEEEYDDEEYDDEEYDDEEYPEEDYPEEEEYYEDDGGYVEDDRLSKVLDELAELKRSVGMPAPAPSFVQQPSHTHPFVISHGGGGGQNNEIAIYNEISRLRNELGRTQSTQEMHVELSRLKDQIEKDARQNETGLLGEIKRLNERVVELSDGKKSAVPRLSAAASYGLHGTCVGEEVLRTEFAKLIAINETILRTVKDDDKKMYSQISDIRKRVTELPDFTELLKNIEELKKSVSRAEQISAAAVPVATPAPAPAPVPVAAPAPAPIAAPIQNGNAVLHEISMATDKIKETISASAEPDNSEILRQLYDLKTMLGSASGGTAKRNKDILSLYNDLHKVKFDCTSKSLPLSEKLKAIDEFSIKLASVTEPATTDIYHSLLYLTQKLLGEKLSRSSLDELKKFASIPAKKQESAEAYAKLYERLKRASVLDIIELLPEVVSAVDELQDGKKTAYNDALYSEILDLANEYATSDVENHAAAAKIKDKIEGLCSVTLYDLSKYVPERPPLVYKSSSAEGVDLIGKLNELMAVIADLNVVSSDAGAPVENAASSGLVLKEIAALKEEIFRFGSQNEIVDAVAALKADYIDIARRIDAIKEAQDVQTADILTAVPDEKITQDIEFIKTKLEEQDAFITQIADLRSDILLLPTTIAAETATTEVNAEEEVPAVSGAFGDELNAQLDKLYEDLAAAMADSSGLLTQQVADIGIAVTSVAETVAGLSGLEAQVAAVADSVNNLTGLEAQITGVSDSVLNISDLSVQIVTDLAEIKNLVSGAEIKTESTSPQAAYVDDSLISEITQMRTLLEKSDTLTNEQSEALQNQVAILLDEVAMLKADLSTKDTVSTEATIKEESAIIILNEICDKLNSLMYGVGGDEIDNIQILIADVNDIKEKLFAVDETVVTALNKISEDLKTGAVSTSEDDRRTLNTSEESVLILEDLAAIKEKLQIGTQTTTAEIDAVKEEIQAARLRDTDEVTSELERIYNELKQLRVGLSGEVGDIRSDITEYRDQVVTREPDEVLNELIALREDIKTTGPASSEVNMILGEIVALRDEVQAYRDELTVLKEEGGLREETVSRTPDDNENGDMINTIFDELTVLRAEIQNYNEEMRAEQKQDIEALQAGVDELKDSVARRTTLIEKTDDAAAPSSSDELNVVLEEIISLKNSVTDLAQDLDEFKTEQNNWRDNEVQSIKLMLQELLEANYAQKTQTVAEPETLDIAQEFHIIKSQLSDIALLTADKTEPSAVDDTTAEAITLVLDDIAALREEVALLTQKESVSTVQTHEQVPAATMVADAAILDEFAALKEQIAQLSDTVTVMLSREQTLQTDAVSDTYAVSDTSADTAVLDEISLLKEQISELSDMVTVMLSREQTLDTDAVSDTYAVSDTSADTVVLDEISLLKEQISELSDMVTVMLSREQTQEFAPQASEQAPTTSDDALALILTDLGELKEQVSAVLDVSAEPRTAAPPIADETLFELSDAIAALKEQIASLSGMDVTREGGGDSALAAVLFDEIASLKEQIASLADVSFTAAPVSAPQASQEEGYNAEVINAVLDEIASLRADLSISKKDADTSGLLTEVVVLGEQVSAIGKNVRALNEEPDRSVVGEILALRDEFQAFKDELNAARTEPDTESGAPSASNEEVLNEISTLRDQLFTISMASISSDKTGDAQFESYNNLILDEINALRDEVAAIKNADASDMLKAAQSGLVAQLDKLSSDIEFIKASSAQIDTLQTEFSASRDANESLLNFLSEIASLVERQGRIISGVSDGAVNLDEKLEVVKREIAATVSESARANSASAAKEISRLKEEIAKEKPAAKDNEKILQEIRRLKEEFNSLNQREARAEKQAARSDSKDKNLSVSIHDLKAELNQIADFVSDNDEPPKPPKKPAAKKAASTSSAKRKTTSATAKKTTASAPKKPAARKKPESRIETVIEDSSSMEELFTEDLISKINREGQQISQHMMVDESMFGAEDELDVASRLAKQVANKLVMEQLVQQLGDGGVPQSQIEEIVKDILPQEFSTIQIDEQSDQVRRLANSLVLDKLRARLTGKK